MKWIIVLSLLFTGFVTEAKKMSLEEVKAFLADERKQVIEPGTAPFQTSQDIAFSLYLADNWQRALTLLENDAPNRRQQNLIVVAAEAMPAQDYVRFLNGVCGFIESGKLELPGWSFGFGSDLKEGFLAYNYDQPEVVALINRLEAIYKAKEPGKWDEYLSSIKSGDGKKNLVEALTSYGDPMPETYKANSKEVYHNLVNTHKKLLEGKPLEEIWAEEEAREAIKKDNIVRRVLGTENFGLYFCMVVLIIGGFVTLWLYLKKN